VSNAVKQTPNSLGYVELIFAVQKHLAYGRVRNPSVNFVKAELASVTAAASDSAKTMPDDPWDPVQLAAQAWCSEARAARNSSVKSSAG
jgi:ABC-type phosphate transport system substrate-binding protein